MGITGDTFFPLFVIVYLFIKYILAILNLLTTI